MIEENVPRRDEPEDTKFWCEEHGCYMFKDFHGQEVCVVCLIEDRLFISDRYETLLHDEHKRVVYDRERNQTEIHWEIGIVERYPGRIEI